MSYMFIAHHSIKKYPEEKEGGFKITKEMTQEKKILLLTRSTLFLFYSLAKQRLSSKDLKKWINHRNIPQYCNIFTVEIM